RSSPSPRVLRVSSSFRPFAPPGSVVAPQCLRTEILTPSHHADEAFHRLPLLRPEHVRAGRGHIETVFLREPAQIGLRMPEAPRRADLEAPRSGFLRRVVRFLRREDEPSACRELRRK